MADLRQRILGATEQLLTNKGPAGITTREIARAAGCSDGALYKHFESLDALFLELFKEKLPVFTGLQDLAFRVGERTVEQNLLGVLETGLVFIRSAMPIWLALAGEADLREAFSRRLSGEGRGPHIPIQSIAAYLRAEQRLGRVRADADVTSTASLMLAALMQRALFERMLGPAAGLPNDRQWARAMVSAITEGCASPEAGAEASLSRSEPRTVPPRPRPSARTRKRRG